MNTKAPLNMMSLGYGEPYDSFRFLEYYNLFFDNICFVGICILGIWAMPAWRELVADGTKSAWYALPST